MPSALSSSTQLDAGLLTSAFPPDFETTFLAWRLGQKPRGLVTDVEYQNRHWVLNNPGTAPTFNMTHNSWLHATRTYYKLSDDKQDVLYRSKEDATKWFKLVPASSVFAKVKSIHCITLSHAGIHKTYDAISPHYHGISRKDVTRILEACNVCMTKWVHA